MRTIREHRKSGALSACLLGLALAVLCVPADTKQVQASVQDEFAVDESYASSEEIIENEISPSDFYQQSEPVSEDSDGIALYSTNDSKTIDVTDLGANGSDKKDDGSAIQEALNEADNNEGTITVSVPAGTSYISKTLTLYSGTVLSLDSQASIVRTDDSKIMATTAICDSKNGGGYTRASDITLRGGVWNGNASGDSYHSIFEFSHCQNIDVEDVTFKNWSGRHALSFHGSQNITVRNCTFKNFLPSEGMERLTAEAVHLDYVSESSGGNTPYDDTACQNVLIAGCTFDHCHGGIGTHHVAPSSSNITITGNSFSNLTGACVRLPNFHDVNINNNTVSTARVFCYLYNGSSDVTINGNTVDCGRATSLCSNKNAIYVRESEATITDNIITNAVAAGIALKTDASGVIIGNSLSENGSRGIFVSTNSTATISDNVITDNESAGIRVADDSQAYMRDNTISHNHTHGIRVEESDILAFQNTISENDTDGIRTTASTFDIEGNLLENNAEHDIHIDAKSSGILSGNTGTEVYQINSENILDETGTFCNHNYVMIEMTEPTCTQNGRILYECESCQDTYTEILPMSGHQVVTDQGVASTCTSTGISDGSHCAVCGAVIIKQGVVSKAPHTEKTDKAVKATCTKTGLTEGSHCSVCGTVIVAQKTTAKLGHSYQWMTDKKAGYGTAGKIHRECTRCGKITKEKTIAASVKHCLRPQISNVKKKSLKLSWNAVKDATKYVVYGAKCSQKKFTKIGTTTGRSLTIKNLKKDSSYKYYVAAYHGKAILTQSYKVHASTTGGKYGNPSKITADKTSISVKAGKSKTVSAAVSASKPVLQHTAKVRYYSTNKSVAKVTAKGKITGVNKGSCRIYAVAQNGRKTFVKVTVR